MDDGRRGFHRVSEILGILVAAAVVWTAFIALALWRYQERVVFQPPSLMVEAPASATRVQFPAADGHALYGLLVSPSAESREPRAESREPKTVVIAFHGNADLSAWRVPWAQELARRAGVHVLLAEYRGYGGIPGAASYAAAHLDATGALAYVRSEFRDARLVLYGHSLGSAIATELAATIPAPGPASLVVESPFTSARDMATRMLLPPVPGLWSVISRVHYDTRAKVAAAHTPVWVAHGTRDVVVPVRMGRAVFAAARCPGKLLIVEGAGHNDVADVGGGRYWEWITRAVLSPVVELEKERDGCLP